MELLVKSITAPMPTLIPRPLILFKGAVGRGSSILSTLL